MFKVLKAIVALFSAIGLIQHTVATTPVRKCPNGEVKPLSVKVDSCTEMPCDLWRGFASNLAIQFVSIKDLATDIKAEVFMSTLGIGMPFDLTSDRSDVCKNLMFGSYCPMYEGEDATYHLVLPIAQHQPEVPAKIEVFIKDAIDDTVLACFILDARIRKRNGPLTNSSLKVF